MSADPLDTMAEQRIEDSSDVRDWTLGDWWQVAWRATLAFTLASLLLASIPVVFMVTLSLALFAGTG